MFPLRVELAVADPSDVTLYRPFQIAGFPVPDFHCTVITGGDKDGVERVEGDSVDIGPMSRENEFWWRHGWKPVYITTLNSIRGFVR